MAPTQDCSTGISREHYVSGVVLKQFPGLLIEGMPWQPRGEAKNYPLSALAANILCDRHNSALSPIDTLAARAFGELTAAADYAVDRATPGRVQHHLISGEALELWMYKLAAGIHFAGIARTNGAALRDSSSFPVDIVQALASGQISRSGCLYVVTQPGTVRRDQLQVAPLVEIATNRHVGVAVRFRTVMFETMIVDSVLPLFHRLQIAPQKRPDLMDFIGLHRDARVVLTWNRWSSEIKGVRVQLQR